MINLSGLRDFLFPGSPSYRPELGWVAGALAWTSGITVPVSLFSNGVWLYGKTFSRETWMRVRWVGGRRWLRFGTMGRHSCSRSLHTVAVVALNAPQRSGLGGVLFDAC